MTVYEYQAEHSIEREAAEVIEFFLVHPSSWLRAFLRLAARQHASSKTSSGTAAPLWYRLAPIEQRDPHSAVANFIWRPRCDGPVFSRFHGTIDISASGEGARLAIAGIVTDGDRAVNAAILTDAIALVATAIAAPSLA
jgi:hypothetical protein